MKKLAELISVYQQHHKKQITKITHFIGVPCIIFAVLIFLSWFQIGFLNTYTLSVSWILVAALILYYGLYDWILALTCGVFLIILAFLAGLCAGQEINSFNVLMILIFFIGGWALQFAGHYYEGKKPAFMVGLKQILIAPIFLVTEIFFMLGYKRMLQEEALAFSLLKNRRA